MGEIRMKPFLASKNVFDIEISGNLGEFFINQKDTQNGSIPVTFIQTSVSLETSNSHEERLLRELRPFREIFNISELDFEDILQRDLDDSRVSSELIPYLLKAAPSGLVKFFPPIIAVLLPCKNNSIQERFAPVTSNLKPTGNPDFQTLVTLSKGDTEPSFELEKYVDKNGNIEFSYPGSLKINSTANKLIIVDGQHRAMALLALFRNITEWPDKAEKYKRFYEQWTDSSFSQYDLKKVRLPVCICVFNSLNETNQIDPTTVSKACRSIFLALNKNARPVSRARNFLLQDSDIISVLLRETLHEIKSFKPTDNELLRLHSVQLDSPNNESVISSPTAITSVMNLYNILDRLLMSGNFERGIFQHNHRLEKMQILNHLVKKLNLTEEFADDELRTSYRDIISSSHQEKIILAYNKSLSNIIIKCFDEIALYRAHNSTCIKFENKLKTEYKIQHGMMFEGEGFRNSYIDHSKKLEELTSNQNTGLSRISEGFSKEISLYKNTITDFQKERAAEYIGIKLTTDHPQTITIVNEVFKLFSTSAFQTALVDAVFSECIQNVDQSGEIINDYIASLNTTLNILDSSNKEKSLINLSRIFFKGISKIDGAIETKQPLSFKQLLIGGEMNPGHWPYMRHIIYEIWFANTNLEFIKNHLQDNIQNSRHIQGRQLFKRLKNNYLVQENKSEQELATEEVNILSGQTYTIFSEALDSIKNHLKLDKKLFISEIKKEVETEYEEELSKVDTSD